MVGLGKTWPFNLDRACSSTGLELVSPRAAEAEELDTLIRDGRRWSAAREADPTVGPDARFNALLPVLDKEAPAFIRADTAPQIETAVAFGARHDIDVVIVGGDEAMECVETLLPHDIPVVVWHAPHARSTR